MSDADVTLVWVAPDRGTNPAQRLDAVGEESLRAIKTWAEARGIRLTAAVDGGARRYEIDVSIGEDVERELEHAREAIAALDADAAERALARAEALLRAHPELPQAAWQRAEVARAWSTRFRRVEPKDETRASSEWQSADALDGGRTSGVGEAPFAARAAVPVSIAIHGAGSDLVLRVDGKELTQRRVARDVTTFAFDVIPAEHQVVVYVAGDPVLASWVTVAGEQAIDLHLDQAGSCAAASLARAVREGDRIRASGIACPKWVAAIAGERRGSILIARCEGSTCGSLLEWRNELLASQGPTQMTHASNRWPTWATYALIGVGAAAAATVTIVAMGSLQTRPVETRFVAGGVKIE